MAQKLNFVFRPKLVCQLMAQSVQKQKSSKYIRDFIVVLATVAVWTQKIFYSLLTRPQGSQGCQKMIFFSTNDTIFLLR